MFMKKLISSLVGVCDELQNINKNKIESFKKFIECKDMVFWF